MKLVQFVLPENITRLGIVINNEVHDITPMLPEGKENFIYLLDKAVEQNTNVSEFLGNIVNPDDLKSLDTYLYDELYIQPNSNKPYLTVPFYPPEVWCAGVTYMRSREAREFETVAKSIYDRVYDAERPEIFLKATPQRIVGTNDWVGLRSDSNWMVPEPELGLVISTTPIGADHTAGSTLRAQVDHRKPDGQAQASRKSQRIMTLFDSLGMCMFTMPSLGMHIQTLANLINARYGLNLDESNLIQLSIDTITAERNFNSNAGFRSIDDRLPEFMYKEKLPSADTVFDVPDHELDWVHDEE